MAHLEEFTTYKNTLMEAICTSDTIVNLLKLDTDDDSITGRDMRYSRIFPYNYVPLVTDQASTYICFTVTAPYPKDGVVTQLYLTVYVFTHQDIMRTKNGMRTDLIISEIDKLLNGSTKYGLGKVVLKACDIMSVPSRGYSGLYSVYAVKDFNINICNQY